MGNKHSFMPKPKDWSDIDTSSFRVFLHKYSVCNICTYEDNSKVILCCTKDSDWCWNKKVTSIIVSKDVIIKGYTHYKGDTNVPYSGLFIKTFKTSTSTKLLELAMNICILNKEQGLPSPFPKRNLVL